MKHKQLVISREVLLKFFSPGEHEGYRIIEGGLPSDVSMIGMQYDFLTDAFRIRLVSGEFDEVPEGSMIPELEILMERIPFERKVEHLIPTKIVQ